MSEISKGALTSENNNSFPNNNTGYITPTILRTFNQNMIDSLVDEISYTADSASVNTKITQLQQFSSSLDATFATDAELSASVSALSSSVAATFATDAELSASVSSLSSSVAVTTNGLASKSTANTFQAGNTFRNGIDIQNNVDANLNTNIASNADGRLVFEQGAIGLGNIGYSFDGDITVSGSIYLSGSGNRLFGTSSFATTASFALNAPPTDVSPFLSESVFNSYTQSNDSKVNSLINATGSFITESETGSMSVLSSSFAQTASFLLGSVQSASFATTASYAANADLLDGKNSTEFATTTGSNTFNGQQNFNSNTLFFNTVIIDDSNILYVRNIFANQPAGIEIDPKGAPLKIVAATTHTGSINVTGSVTASAGFRGNLIGTASFATTASFALNVTPIDTSSLVSTSSFNSYTQSNDSKVNSLINKTGSLATTGSNIFTAGNTFGQGITIKQPANPLLETNIATNPDGRLVFDQGAISDGNIGYSFDGDITVSGSVYLSGSGKKLFGTASFAENSTSASFATTASFALNASLTDTSSFATTGSNTFNGNQTISGSLIGSSVNGGIIKIQSDLNTSSSLSIPFGYISSSNPNIQTNILFGTAANTGSGLLDNNQTGSIVISGSNNIILNSNRTNTLVTAGTYGYLGGNGNIGNIIPTLDTGSVLRPLINNNALQATLNLKFTTSSIAGGIPAVVSNLIYGATNINHQSGSVTLSNNCIIGANLTSNQNVTTGNIIPSISNNIISAGLVTTLNHNSSSINYAGNLGGCIITNNYSSSVSTAVDNIAVTTNLFNGNGNTIVVSGSNSGTRRTFNSNLFAGRSNLVNSEHSGSPFTGGHLVSTALLGQSLIVSASHTSTTDGGTVIVGRYNATGSLQESSANAVFVVGTGGSASTRRNAIHIDSVNNIRLTGSVNLSGSFNTNGNAAFTGSVNVSGSTLTLQKDGGVALSIQSGSFELTTPQGSGSFYSNVPITSSGLRINGDALVSDLIISGVFSGNSSLQVLGNSSFTGSSSFIGTALFSTGSNKQAGTAVLDGGNPASVVVSNSLVTANSIIMLTKQTLTNHASVSITAKSGGSFTIGSSHNGDTDTVGWFIINNS